MPLQGKRILLGVCGGIAAYKAAALCSRLAQAGAEVRVIMTASAVRFVAPLTFQALSRHQVMTDTFEEKDASVISHIDLADHADLIVIAPATANMLAKMAHGIADDMLSTTLLAATSPVLAAPAMNVHMYEHPAVRANVELLKSRGVAVFEPNEGQLACGYVGKGRLAEPEEIFAEIVRLFDAPKPLQGRRVLVTAGGTVERIDPVRYLTNDSSGKMGYAIAEEARGMGAEVVLVSGPTALAPPAGVDFVQIGSAQEMLEAVLARFERADIVIKAAAVADYRPETASPRKIKKTADTLTLVLKKNPDILQTLGDRKTTQFLVGFAAETDDVAQYAMDKVARKNCDLLVANNVLAEGAGFKHDTNRVDIYDVGGLVRSLPLMSKKEVARQLLAEIALRAGAGREG